MVGGRVVVGGLVVVGGGDGLVDGVGGSGRDGPLQRSPWQQSIHVERDWLLIKQESPWNSPKQFMTSAFPKNSCELLNLHCAFP